MNRVEKHVINKLHEWYNYCEEVTQHSRKLYNTCNYTQRQSYFYGWGIKTQAQLDKFFQSDSNYRALPAKVSQLVLKQCTDAWASYFKAMQEYHKEPQKFAGSPREPNYIQERNLVKFNIQAIGKKAFSQGFIIPSKSPIRIPVKLELKFEDLCEVRIVPKVGCFVIEVVYEISDNKDFFCSLNPTAAAIDIGLDNLATITFNDFSIQPLIVNGKPLKSVNKFYNKQVARAKGFIKRGTSRRIQNIIRNRNNFINNYLHSSTKLIVDEFVRLGVTEVSIGKNEQWKTHLNLGKKVNQSFTQIPHAKFIEILTYKLEKVGIAVLVDEESYTSRASFIEWDNIPTFNKDNKVKHEFSGKRVSRAWYVSKNGIKIHADVNGSYNIGRKSNPEAFNRLKLIVRDMGCLVVHPRRITPTFRRGHAQLGVAQTLK